MRVLVSLFSPIRAWNIPDADVARLRAAFPQHEFAVARTAAEARAFLPEAEVAYAWAIDQEAFGAARRLRWVHSPAAGVGSLLFDGMRASAVILTNSRGTHAEAMAEHALGLIVALFRKFPEALAHQRAHRWGHEEMIEGAPCRLVRGATIGVVGPGGIGSAVARLAAAFGARVEVVRRRPELGAPEGASAVYGPGALRERLPHWDVLVLAAPLTAETRGLIGRAELEAMKRDAILVNVGRGKLVKEAELVDALRAGVIRGAALDVVEHEPLDPSSPLWDLPNLLITPHISGLRPDHWAIATSLFMENLRRFDAGEPLLNVVDKERGY